MKDFLIPECYYEQELLVIFGYSIKNDIIKAAGCNGVISAINRGYKNKLAIGWVDQDPMQQVNRHPDYNSYHEFVLPRHKIRLKQKTGSQHFIIEIEDEFEKWFEQIGSQKGIRMEDFGIPFQLHQYSKKKIPGNVRRYLEAVINNNSVPFNYIRTTINDIVKNNS